MWRALKSFLWTLKIALPKVAVGWMFALLTIDFNRVAIVEMGVAAVVVTTLLSIHYFIAPFQVIAGRIADTRPILGYRRTPYLIGASAVASLLFLALPSVTFAMGEGSSLATAVAVVLFVLFGLCMAVMADSYHSLIAETTTKDTRAGVISVVWIVMILSTILAAVVMNAVRPEFSPEAMQNLYNMTPPIVLGAVLLGVIGVERRLSPSELTQAATRARAMAPPGNPLASAARLVAGNRQARYFFIFVACAIFALFLQESLIEVLGAEVFGAGIRETTRFQPIWGGGILLGMLGMGLLSAFYRAPKKTLTLVGCAAASAGFFLLGIIALLRLEFLLVPTLFVMGICAGVFNVGALAMMMDMTVEGATGLYMGLWGTAQAMGMGGSSVAAGALHTSLIGSGLLEPQHAYWMIFSLEASVLLGAAAILTRVDVAAFQRTAVRSVEETSTDSAVILDVATASA
ncbi:BCD family MFS transporter [Chromatocurvus halotolerans]|uniref:BCD family chlorophyll transporter-like MFS transporter n=1 Tax=Chromatocurvus halotolerans TaxID=1132028 RepID=A0A4R2KF01_9GAMM|nr:BCD family MFS transporter [Chromatocurvus halotolerans]TCO72241.1 BCD family chlorophyll transporter-like MFS transporter [Chromatocurvus halotolerans]